MTRAILPELDTSLYPQVWEQQTFTSPHSLLVALLNGSLDLDPKAFTKQLLSNNIYQEWINATVFGRYIQRSFAAFYRQTEDSFNMDMPALFRNELMRHAQYLPSDQTLFVAGNMPKSARKEKLFTSTINPATAVLGAQKICSDAIKSGRSNHQGLILNQIKVVGQQVVGFPIRHNRLTSERIRNEVLVLDFRDLRLTDEKVIASGRPEIADEATGLLRYYELR